MVGRLALGGHHEVAAAAAAVVNEQPLRETGWAILMLALYRSSRQAEALRAYRRLARVLDDELGIEPSSGLSALEEAIILQKPELDWSEDARVDLASSLLNVSTYGQPRPSPIAKVTPQANDSETTPTQNLEVQAPSPHKSFIGREEELLWLKDHIRRGSLVTLTGPAGVGKTRIALQAAREPPTDQWRRSPCRGPLSFRARRGRAPSNCGHSRHRVDGTLPPRRGTWRSDERSRPPDSVLDDCERLRDSSASAVVTLLTQCPDLAFVATSREPLDAPREAIYKLHP